ncbi:prepilin-type N-terminal cleavage/methylation domain-containing protein [Vibrio hannami]|uniref:prepilin-type N-terminal cleavage/methylation domain-containing protein n=1 Tax=Vibrio hannami TaxID=2717094 RepID=UPI00240F9521|nr:prepilin-type N-terminal cleavage/methylation domain-containing protein [Vibrio hannami]MDG3084793.1 prepilin-type N-terminal cleavage/methylation domain-containing protein [Vibrio hannami]
MKKTSGFTLVELVVVIVIVGLLAVAALPKFLDVTDEAKKASIEGVAGGFATAVLSARAQWEAEARPTNVSGDNSVDYDGTDFLLTSSSNSGFRDGYPIALDDGTASDSSVTSTDCRDLMDELLQNPPQVEVSGSTTSDTSYSAEATGSGECQYTQLEGTTGHYFTYDITTGRVTVSLQ